MEGEFNEVAISTNKVDKFEEILVPLKLTNYNLGKILRSNSKIHIVHVKSVKILNSHLGTYYEDTNLQEVKCVFGRPHRTNNWSFDEDWSFTIRKDQDSSGNDPLKNSDLVNFIHLESNKAIYFDDGKKTPDDKETHVSARKFQDDLMGFQWYINFVYTPYDDEYLRSGTIIKINGGNGPLSCKTDYQQFGNPEWNDNFVIVNSNNEPDSEGNFPEDENEYWVVLEQKEKGE